MFHTLVIYSHTTRSHIHDPSQYTTCTYSIRYVNLIPFVLDSYIVKDKYMRNSKIKTYVPIVCDHNNCIRICMCFWEWGWERGGRCVFKLPYCYLQIRPYSIQNYTLLFCFFFLFRILWMLLNVIYSYYFVLSVWCAVNEDAVHTCVYIFGKVTITTWKILDLTSGIVGASCGLLIK